MDGFTKLSDRLLRLDLAADRNIYSGCAHDLDILHFIKVMEEDQEPNKSYFLSTSDADTLVSECKLLRRLMSRAPEIAAPQLRFESQFWTATRKPPWVDIKPSTPTAESFVDVSTANFSPSTKPFNVGLFTSTSVCGRCDMWYLYIKNSAESPMFSRPWHRWRVTPKRDARVYEIGSATQWAQFVMQYPLRHNNLIYPDWISAADEFDAVHMSIVAIAAIEGMYIQTDQGIVAPSYWGVESTFWLHWCFDSFEHVALQL